jgi:hypothetical protein
MFQRGIWSQYYMKCMREARAGIALAAGTRVCGVTLGVSGGGQGGGRKGGGREGVGGGEGVLLGGRQHRKSVITY